MCWKVRCPYLKPPFFQTSYELLESRGQLSRVTIPVDAAETEPKGFVFVSPDFQTNPDLMILIHGNGVVGFGSGSEHDRT